MPKSFVYYDIKCICYQLILLSKWQYQACMSLLHLAMRMRMDEPMITFNYTKFPTKKHLEKCQS
jgi:hypothetical protein